MKRQHNKTYALVLIFFICTGCYQDNFYEELGPYLGEDPLFTETPIILPEKSLLTDTLDVDNRLQISVRELAHPNAHTPVGNDPRAIAVDHRDDDYFKYAANTYRVVWIQNEKVIDDDYVLDTPIGPQKITVVVVHLETGKTGTASYTPAVKKTEELPILPPFQACSR